MDETVDLDALALATAGLVGSDLANMINEAAINAVKNGRSLSISRICLKHLNLWLSVEKRKKTA